MSQRWQTYAVEQFLDPPSTRWGHILHDLFALGPPRDAPIVRSQLCVCPRVTTWGAHNCGL